MERFSRVPGALGWADSESKKPKPKPRQGFRSKKEDLSVSLNIYVEGVFTVGFVARLSR